MKESAFLKKKQISHNVDKRDLINIDFYKNEIKIMEEQLDEVAEKSLSKEIHRKIKTLKHELTTHKHYLENFRKNCAPGEINTPEEPVITLLEAGEVTTDEGFFAFLKSFEANFKSLRSDVGDFVNRSLV